MAEQKDKSNNWKIILGVVTLIITVLLGTWRIQLITNTDMETKFNNSLSAFRLQVESMMDQKIKTESYPLVDGVRLETRQQTVIQALNDINDNLKDIEKLLRHQ